MSDFEIESDGEGDFEESYGGHGNKQLASRRPATNAISTKKTASFFGGGAKSGGGGGDEDVYDFDFDAEAPVVKKSYDGKTGSSPTKKTPKVSDSLGGGSGGGGGGLRRTESMSRSPTSMSLEDLMSQHTAEEDPMKKAQRMLKKYSTEGGGKKGPTKVVRHSIEEFNENDIRCETLTHNDTKPSPVTVTLSSFDSLFDNVIHYYRFTT